MGADGVVIGRGSFAIGSIDDGSFFYLNGRRDEDMIDFGPAIFVIAPEMQGTARGDFGIKLMIGIE